MMYQMGIKLAEWINEKQGEPTNERGKRKMSKASKSIIIKKENMCKVTVVIHKDISERE